MRKKKFEETIDLKLAVLAAEMKSLERKQRKTAEVQYNMNLTFAIFFALVFMTLIGLFFMVV